MKRRSFLKKSATAGLALSALPTLIGSVSVQALANAPVLNVLQQLAGGDDRIMVLVQLQGGNDGLNTVIPIEDPLYFDARPSIQIAKSKALTLNNTTGLHPAMTGFKQLYDAGQLAVIQGVTYPNPDRSHFRGTDIWLTATDYNVFKSTGWVGRYLESFLPANYPASIPTDPLAIQIGSSLSLTFQGTPGALGITFRDPDEFYKLVGKSTVIGGGSTSSGTPADNELEFIRTVQNAAEAYSQVIKKAGDSGNNSATYPNSDLAEKLKVVARLISGGLKTKFYLVSIGGYDTHISQGNETGTHSALLSQLSGAITAFMDDIQKLGYADKVAGMTFSEFGRRVKENGSKGTDHGTAAPMFVFGAKALGGKIIGSNPQLDSANLDERGDIKMQHDYREVYASALAQWFGTPTNQVEEIMLKKQFTTMPLFEAPNSVDDLPDGSLYLQQNIPNPAKTTTTIRYMIPSAMSVRLTVFTVQGKKIATIFSGEQEAGLYDAQFSTSELPSGTYYYRLETNRFTAVKTMVISR
ncbi:MAG: DUF1501 domain-containing protein [Bacteroidetes bacterium]|nr:DUF1501 domain-containing protein [Bacteroidota bacterium]